jgi:hypothetical protein
MGVKPVFSTNSAREEQVVTSDRFTLTAMIGVLMSGTLFLPRLGEADGKYRPNHSESRTPVLVELFTSEGCSDCPPADALLEKLDRLESINNVEIIALSEHVDYWNDIGWKDPYSSGEYSLRQGAYGRQFGLGSVYTPQMVVDGRAQFVGSNETDAVRAIENAGKIEKIPLSLSSIRFDGADRIVLHVEASPSPSSLSGGNAEMLLAVADDTDISSVTRGENAGRTLKHVAVVRTLVSVGKLGSRGTFSQDVAVNLIRGTTRNFRVVAIIQQPEAGRVLGVGIARISN